MCLLLFNFSLRAMFLFCLLVFDQPPTLEKKKDLNMCEKPGELA